MNGHMPSRIVVASLSLMMLALLGPAPGHQTVERAEAQSLEWHVDVLTGVEWRQLRADELQAIGYGDFDGWVSRNYGNLDRFGMDDGVEIALAYEDTIHEITFEFSFETIVPAHLQQMGLNGTTTSGEGSSWWNETIRGYESDAAWQVYASLPSGQLTGVMDGPDKQFLMYGPDARLEIPGTYVYVVGGPLPTCTGGESRIDITLSECGSGGGGDGDDDPDPGPPAKKYDVTVTYIGEIEYCTQHPNWFTDMETLHQKSETTFADTEAKPLQHWRSCSVVTEGLDYDHDLDTYVHVHNDGNENVHPYPFNVVESDHAIGGCQNKGIGYMDAETRLDGERYNAYGTWGPWAAVVHDLRHAPDFITGPDLVQLVHKGNLNDGTSVRGVACQDSTWSMITEPPQGVSSNPLSTAHEIGHNLGAVHCEAVHLGGGIYTIMASGQDTGDGGDNDCPIAADEHAQKFSNGNIKRVNELVRMVYA